MEGRRAAATRHPIEASFVAQEEDDHQRNQHNDRENHAEDPADVADQVVGQSWGCGENRNSSLSHFSQYNFEIH